MKDLQKKIELAYMCISIVHESDAFTEHKDRRKVRRRPSYPYGRSTEKSDLAIKVDEMSPVLRYGEVHFRDHRVYKFRLKENKLDVPVEERSVELETDFFERLDGSWESKIRELYASMFQK